MDPLAGAGESWPHASPGMATRVRPHGRSRPLSAGPVAAALVVLVAWLRVLTVPAHIESEDGHNFVRAVGHYSVPLQQPHWPGYPVYVWLGKLGALAAADAGAGLHGLAVAASSLCVLPILGIAARLAGGDAGRSTRAGVAAGLLWSVAPASWLAGTEIYSDSVALLLALAALWWQLRALEGRGVAFAPAAIAGGLMLGARLAYLPLLLSLAYVTWLKRADTVALGGRRVRVPALVAATWCGTVAVWLTWQLAMTGAGAFLVATLFHLVGHFVEWGNAANLDADPTARAHRFVALFGYYALGAWAPGAPAERWLATVAWGGLVVSGTLRVVRGWRGRLAPQALTLLLWIVPYLVGVFLVHDLTLLRYALPAVACLSILAALGLPGDRVRFWMILVACVLAIASVTAPLAAARRGPHVAARIASFVRSQGTSAHIVLLSDVHTINRALHEALPGMVRPVRNAARPLEAVSPPPRPGIRVFVLAKAPVPAADAVLLARFCHDDRLDPSVPREAWLYRLRSGREEPPPPAAPGPRPVCR